MALEVRRTGGGEFYLVSVDGNGVKDIHQNSKLLKFKTSKEAKDALVKRIGKDTVPKDTVPEKEEKEEIKWH